MLGYIIIFIMNIQSWIKVFTNLENNFYCHLKINNNYFKDSLDIDKLNSNTIKIKINYEREYNWKKKVN